MAPTIDLNADLGESVDGVPTADDAALFPLITSANVACGGHAGDADSMRETIARAREHGVVIGAHPSYPDRPGFGRTAMQIDAGELTTTLTAQLFALHDAGAEIRYVKPHGALYNVAVHDTLHARAVVDATLALAKRAGRRMGVLGLGGEIRALAEGAGLIFRTEAFLDRGYQADGTLVPRGQPGDLLHDADAVAERAVLLATGGVVFAVDGTPVSVSAASLCVHADTVESVQMALAVRAALDSAGVGVRSPW